MFRLHYLAKFDREPAAGGYSVSFPDLPEAFTGGDDLEDALAQASDCLGEALSARIHDREDIPTPGGAATASSSGLRRVAVPLDLAPKVAVYMAMRAEGVNASALARRMGVRETIVRRILDPKTATHLATIEQALTHLGRTATLTVANAVPHREHQHDNVRGAAAAAASIA